MDLSPHVRTIPVTERDIPVLQMVIDQYVAAQDETDAAINRLVDADIEMERRHNRRMAESRRSRRAMLIFLICNAVLGSFIGYALMTIALHS